MAPVKRLRRVCTTYQMPNLHAHPPCVHVQARLSAAMHMDQHVQMSAHIVKLSSNMLHSVSLPSGFSLRRNHGQL